MNHKFRVFVSLAFLSLIGLVAAGCSYQGPAFSLPDYENAPPILLEAFTRIEAAILETISDPKFNTTSYSIEVTSSHKTLWTSFHTAQDKNKDRPGAKAITGDSAYRIASITKVFTVLGILRQSEAGKLSLDDPVDKYLTDLQRRQEGTIQWRDITLRSLASQLSGIPRDWAQSDLSRELDIPSMIGLPSATSSNLPHCDSYADYKPCTETELLDYLSASTPVFSPNQKSTYSNIAFELLGMVIANVTGRTYEEYIETAILEPLGMSGSAFDRPPDSRAVLPKNESWYWDIDEGVQNPTGGLYASSSDMSKFLRYVLTHYGSITHTVNWLHPASFTAGMSSFYGMPWEIFRTHKILANNYGEENEARDNTGTPRTVTFYTKGGGLPGYITNVIVVPEYDLGITIFTGGDTSLLALLREQVTVPLIQAADKVVQAQIEHVYVGKYVAPGSSGLNSSLDLKYTVDQGLRIDRWTSNGTDVLAALPIAFQAPPTLFGLQLVPTFQHHGRNKSNGNGNGNQDGELWRFIPVMNVTDESNREGKVWSDFCISDIDWMIYDGNPFNEIVFRNRGKDGRYGTVEITGYKVSLTRSASGKSIQTPLEDERLVVQDL
ncbi:hypothetical protein PV08_08486 [Exophiala spinifera]|uniref:Uncharacterized protein n=1 Tax=Exophiala spinifera TaxID=91928 RepID=A0A0D2B2Y3_9EURO|nr:uncharacterized protein PV08_08486 [Exophiala spinifera]KIW13298.1 hypothetical protein PV08_08486 [Exophiala spinifera]